MLGIRSVLIQSITGQDILTLRCFPDYNSYLTFQKTDWYVNSKHLFKNVMGLLVKLPEALRKYKDEVLQPLINTKCLLSCDDPATNERNLTNDLRTTERIKWVWK